MLIILGNQTKPKRLCYHSKKTKLLEKKTSDFEKYQKQFSAYPAKDNAEAAAVILPDRAESEWDSMDRGCLIGQKDVSLEQDHRMILLRNDTFFVR